MSKRSNWSDEEVRALRNYVSGDGEKFHDDVVQVIQSINPSRNPREVASKFVHFQRLFGYVPGDVRKVISGLHSSGYAPDAIAMELEKAHSFRVGLRRLVEVMAEDGLLPKGAAWRDFVPKAKTCAKCGHEGPSGEFNFDASRTSGLRAECRACRK